MVPENKITKIKEEIAAYKKILIAYSGGVDSTLLLKIAVDVLGENNVIAATASSDTYTAKELNTAKEITEEFGIKHIIFHTNEFDDINFINNPPERCYHCKKELFEQLVKIQNEFNCNVIMDGANYDDRNDFRPGTQAEIEYNIITPLKNAEFTKKEIREYSRELKLKTYDFPALACLASRIPYHEKITRDKLDRIRKAEEFLSKYNFKDLRVRTSENTARIEVHMKEFQIILENKQDIISQFKKLGYQYITLDLEGFRSGSMNEIL